MFKASSKETENSTLKVQVNLRNARTSAMKQTRSAFFTLESCRFPPNKDGGPLLVECLSPAVGWKNVQAGDASSLPDEFISIVTVFHRMQLVTFLIGRWLILQFQANLSLDNIQKARRRVNARQKVQQDTWGEHMLMSALLLKRLKKEYSVLS